MLLLLWNPDVTIHYDGSNRTCLHLFYGQLSSAVKLRSSAAVMPVELVEPKVRLSTLRGPCRRVIAGLWFDQRSSVKMAVLGGGMQQRVASQHVAGRRVAARVPVSAQCRRMHAVVRAAAAAAAPEAAPAQKFERPDASGRFGKFGGKYVPETLIPALAELEAAYKEAMADPAFQVCGLDMVVELAGLGGDRQCYLLRQALSLPSMSGVHLCACLLLASAVVHVLAIQRP